MKNEYNGLEVAIIGMSCRFPGANNWREYWNNLVNGVESLDFFTDEELYKAGVSEATIKNKTFVKAKSCLKGKDLFDSAFFEYRPDEANVMNPEIRVLHECLWEALEDAAYDPEKIAGSVGLFLGGGDDLNWKAYTNLKNENIDQFTLNYLNNKDFLATILAYKFNFKGTAIALNTACSTSLAAVNLAYKSLLLGENKIAVAGGVSFSSSKEKGYFYQEGMIHSKDGHCRSFDKDASGTVAGEGAGMVILKRLKDAISDNDNIYAIIKGTASNNDGNRKVGFTAPSIAGQAECIVAAQKFAKIKKETISYIEAHGTGTKLGDPIEIRALNEAFGLNGNNKYCAIGSVKSNIGHLDAAAGIAGLIKVALSLKFKKIPASLNYFNANPEIDFDSGPFYVNTKLVDWKNNDDMPNRAGISSFGIGGTNVHVVLEEAPEDTELEEKRSYNIINLSARTKNALDRTINNFKKFVLEQDKINYSDLAYTLNVGRKFFEYRKSFVFNSKDEFIEKLNNKAIDYNHLRVNTKSSEVVFMFSGQGSQYVNMGKALYHSEEKFKEEMDAGFAILQRITSEDYKSIFFPSDENDKRINETQYTQPILFLLEYSLAKLLISFGVAPKYMIGHSIGEYAAACISGVFNYEDALKLVVARGTLMSKMPRGEMISAVINEADAKNHVTKGISIAAINSPEQIVFSGETEAVQLLTKRLNESDISSVKLTTSHAFHSSMLEPIMNDFKEILKKVTFNNIQIPFISNLTGNFITDAEAQSPDYWVKHMREAVRFSDGINSLFSIKQELVFIEIGPGQALCGLVKQNKAAKEIKPLITNLIRSKNKVLNDQEFLFENLGKLWEQGINIDWKRFYSNEQRKKLSLPTYSFEPTKYSAEVNPYELAIDLSKNNSHVTQNEFINDWIYYGVWKTSFIKKITQTNDNVYLLFSSENEFSNNLKTQLSSCNNRVIEIVIGNKFEKISKDKYCIDPLLQSDSVLLRDGLNEDNINITHIIYSWGINLNCQGLFLKKDNLQMNIAYFTLVNIVRCLFNQPDSNKKKLFIITDSLHNITGDETIKYSQSLLLSFLSVVPQEYGASCFNIDIDLSKDNSNLINDIISEFNSSDNSNAIIGYRLNKRWVKDYQKNQLDLTEENKTIRNGGVYLITGGLGNAGFEIAKYLIKNYSAKIILVGRKKMNKDEIDSQDKAYVKLNHLRSLSKDLKYISLDISNSDEFYNCMNEVEQEYGSLNGVIHTAGVIDNSYFELIEDITFEKSEAIFLPKLNGVRNIFSFFAEKKLDFVWITSSIATVLGGISFCTYAAANLFIDHFISANSKKLNNWKSIRLGELVFEENEFESQKEYARTAIGPSEICALFNLSVGIKHKDIEIFESTIDFPYRINQIQVQRNLFNNSASIKEEVVKVDRPELANKYVAPATPTEMKILALVEEFFGMKNIGSEDNFFELGGDSLRAMILLKKINKEFGVNLTVMEFFELQNMKKISLEIDDALFLLKKSNRGTKKII